MELREHKTNSVAQMLNRRDALTLIAGAPGLAAISTQRITGEERLPGKMSREEIRVALTGPIPTISTPFSRGMAKSTSRV
jgi:hypothetical protein